ncbi:hypothetical protein BC831DRAFT_480530 [Entophlyctis helioformis]|nr:hypothetical protein BC831DRAFT_480530 [Entophlyctis helioformis]
MDMDALARQPGIVAGAVLLGFMAGLGLVFSGLMLFDLLTGRLSRRKAAGRLSRPKAGSLKYAMLADERALHDQHDQHDQRGLNSLREVLQRDSQWDPLHRDSHDAAAAGPLDAKAFLQRSTSISRNTTVVAAGSDGPAGSTGGHPNRLSVSFDLARTPSHPQPMLPQGMAGQGNTSRSSATFSFAGSSRAGSRNSGGSATTNSSAAPRAAASPRALAVHGAHADRAAAISPDAPAPVVPAEQYESWPRYQAIMPYTATSKGELTLDTGDDVFVSMVFTDGKVHGVAPRTQTAGLCPIACLQRIAADGRPTHIVPGRGSVDDIPNMTGLKARSAGDRSRPQSGHYLSGLKGPGNGNTPTLTRNAQPHARAGHRANSDANADADGILLPPISPISPSNFGFNPDTYQRSPVEGSAAAQGARGQGQLLFSMIPQDQAMEVVLGSLTPEMRAQYFEERLRKGKSFSSLAAESLTAGAGGSAASSPGHADAASVATITRPGGGGGGASGGEGGASGSGWASPDVESPDVEAGPKKTKRREARQSWQLLRNNWKSAIETRLDSSYSEFEQKRRQDGFDVWKFVADNYS